MLKDGKHINDEMKMTLVARGSSESEHTQFLADSNLAKYKAMRSKCT